MILVTELQGKTRYVNGDMIQYVESNPDTQIVLSNGERLYVQESAETVAERVIEYKRFCHSGVGPVLRVADGDEPDDDGPRLTDISRAPGKKKAPKAD